MTLLNRNSNAAPEAASTSRQSAASAVAGNANGGHAHRSTSSAYRNTVASVTVYFLLLLRDLLTFMTRGGISAMMFAMDQVLRGLLLIAEVFLGPTGSGILGYPCRLVVWLYQMLLWVAYTMVEMIFYLPWQVLLVYVFAMAALAVWMPSPLLDMFTGVFTTLHHFIGVYKTLYRLLGGSDSVISGVKR